MKKLLLLMLIIGFAISYPFAAFVVDDAQKYFSIPTAVFAYDDDEQGDDDDVVQNSLYVIVIGPYESISGLDLPWDCIPVEIDKPEIQVDDDDLEELGLDEDKADQILQSIADGLLRQAALICATDIPAGSDPTTQGELGDALGKIGDAIGKIPIGYKPLPGGGLLTIGGSF